MIKRRLLTLLLVFLMALPFTGCGVVDAFNRGREEAKAESSDSDDEEEDAEEETEEAQEEGSEEESEESEGTLSLFGDNDDEADAEDTGDDDSSKTDTEDVNNLSDEDAKELAEFLSTTDNPSITDWEFVGAALWGGNDNLREYFGNPKATVIHNPLLVEGDWKCVTCPIPDTYSSESSCLGTANIHTLNDQVSFTWEMWLEMEGTFEGGGEEVKDGSPVKFTGNWNDDRTGFTVETDYMMVEIEKFIYLDNTMYALGTDMYISGEKEYVVLIRPISRMEIIDTSDWRYETGNSGNDTSESEKKSNNNNSGSNSEGNSNSGGNSNNGGNSGSGQETGGSSKLSTSEIVERARVKSGAPLARLDSTDPDGTLNIQLYEDAGDHTATWDWYYIDPNTLKGSNFMGDPVDLN